MSRQQSAGQQLKQPSNEYEDWEDEKCAMEIQLQQEQNKVDAIQESIQINQSKFSNEISMLKQMLSEKNQTLKNMDVRPEDRIRI